MWKEITGYKYPYRVNENGTVQQFSRGVWVSLKPITTPRRTEVRLRGLDGKQKHVGVFCLLDLAFCGGHAKKNRLCVCPKNGVKSECTLENLCYKTQAEIGRKSLSRSARKTVIRTGKNGDQTIYSSVSEAARKNGMSTSSLDRRLYHGVLDPRGYRWEISK